MKINWHVEIDTCKLLEKSLQELCNDIYEICEPSTEDQKFVNVTAKAIADCLKRECDVK